jgi:hypothetical protein
VSLRSPAKGLSEAECKKRQAQWQKDISATLAIINDRNVDAKEQRAANARYTELYRQRKEFITESRTGFVWLYLQK